ncbi:MAG: site-specific integrase [Desulfobacterales bacterium]
MPSLTTKRGRLRWRGIVIVQGERRERLFLDDSKKSRRAAIVWEEAERKKLHKFLAEAIATDCLLNQWAGEYLEDVRTRYSKNTYKEKQTAFRRLIDMFELNPHTPVYRIDAQMARRFLKHQCDTRSGYSANKDRKNMARAWRWGLENLKGWPDCRNPFLGVPKFKEVRQPRYVPSEEDFWKVYHQTEGQDQVMLLAFLHLAARRGEIFRIKFSDIDFDHKQIRLWTRKRDGGEEFDWLPMTTDLTYALKTWAMQRKTISVIDQEFVFVCLDENPVCDPYYGHRFKHRQHFMKRMCKKAKVKPFGFHGIRHLTATILYHKGYPRAHIQAVLRHKNLRTTQIYLKSLGLEQVRSTLEEGLKGPAEVIDINQARQKMTARELPDRHNCDATL